MNGISTYPKVIYTLKAQTRMDEWALDRNLEVVDVYKDRMYPELSPLDRTITVECPENCLDMALRYGELGWRVVPVEAGKKKPCIKEWIKRATCDSSKIYMFWEEFPDANVGIVLGRASEIIVVDVDMPYGEQSLEMLEEAIGCSITSDVMAYTPSGGFHLYFSYPSGHLIRTVRKMEDYPNIEICSESAMVVAAPSIGEEGDYIWETSSSPFQEEPSPLPPELLEFILERQKRRKERRPKHDAEIIPEGSRNNTLTSIAGTMHRKGCSFAAVHAALRAENDKKCRPPLSDAEVLGIVNSVSNYPSEDPALEIVKKNREWKSPEAPVCTLDQVESSASEFMPGCDLRALRILLASYLANLLPGKSIWLMVVGGPSTGKSEMILALEDLPLATKMDHIRRSGLISGTARSQMKAGDPGGLLFELGNKGILLFPDMSSLMSMPDKYKRELYGALSRIFDGEYYYQPGNGSKRTYWEGKLGLIGAVTGTIDRQTGFMSEIGQRFLFVRDHSDPWEILGDSSEIPSEASRDLLRKAFHTSVKGLISGITVPDDVPHIPPYESSVLRAAALLTSIGRNHAVKDSNGNPMHLDHIEMPHRLIEAFGKLFRILCLLKCSSHDALRDIVRLALDTISPPHRCKVIVGLWEEREGKTSYALSESCNLPESTVKDTLKELSIMQLVVFIDDSGKRLWSLNEKGRVLMDRLGPFLSR